MDARIAAFHAGARFRVEHPNQNFVVYYFLDGGNAIIQADDDPAEQHQHPSGGGGNKRKHPDNDPPGAGAGPSSSKRRPNRSLSTTTTTPHNVCPLNETVEIRRVENIHQMILEIQSTEDIKIITFSDHDNSFCDALVYKYQEHQKVFQTTYSMFYLLMKGYFTSWYYQHELEEMNETYQNFLLKLNESRKTDLNKMARMDDIREKIESEMKTTLFWYWWPDWAIKEVMNMINLQIKLLSL